MNIYQIYGDYSYNKIKCTQEYHGFFPDQFRLPIIFCPTCDTKHTWGSYHPIPETDMLPAQTPLLLELHELRHRKSDEMQPLLQEYFELRNKNVSQRDNPEPVDEVMRRMNCAGGISPAEFKNIARRLRDILSLPEDRIIGPYAQLGLRDEVYCCHRQPDIIMTVDSYPEITISQQVLDALLAINASGWISYPINIMGIIPCSKSKKMIDLRHRDLIIHGKGGFPANYDRKFYGEDICPECGFFHPWMTEGAETQILDVNSWDGSDFFRLDATLGFFVTERIKQLFERMKLTGCEFRPSSISYADWKGITDRTNVWDEVYKSVGKAPPSAQRHHD
jgi:hypothetical protein